MTNNEPSLQEIQDGITMEPCDSSRIEEFGYDAFSETLALRFRGKPAKDDKPATRGALYHYRGFSETEWAMFRDAPSKGVFFHDVIKAHPERYPYVRVDEVDQE